MGAGPWRLDDDPCLVRTARRLVGETLATWGLDALRDDAVLVVSELLTNGSRHGRPPLTLALTRTGSGAVIEVGDGSPAPPVKQDPGESGRFGMWVVESLAHVTVEIGPGGKTVRAVLPRQ